MLELGAGAGLPSLVCALRGASRVVVTDYPDPDLIENLRYNIAHCLDADGRAGEEEEKVRRVESVLSAQGHLWGADTTALDPPFDVLILADLLFNHSEHAKLITTVQKTLRRSSDARALVYFTPYRPRLLDRDLAFFDLAAEAGFVVEKKVETVMQDVMFEDDPGDQLLRRTVFGYELRWRDP